MLSHMRAFLIILDSLGIGAAPDAASYCDEGSNTIGHLAQAVGSLHLPTMEQLGLGRIPAMVPAGIPINGVSTSIEPIAAWGAMHELSVGKDSTTGHWEIAGIIMKDGFNVFDTFPAELIQELQIRTGRSIMGNKPATGPAIIEELASRHIEEGSWIVYTSADSVFQIAAHEEIIPTDELYAACAIARELCNKYRIGRVIARPFTGEIGNLKRTAHRRDFSYPLPAPTLLNRLCDAGINVTTIGKLGDIFNASGITQSIHVENNHDAQKTILSLAAERQHGLIFGNLIDFDMLYGHRRDCRGYAKALEAADPFIGKLLPHLGKDDILIITADHGNDPTFSGTDHTREFVPLLVYRPGIAGCSLGIRHGFCDVAQSLASFFSVAGMPNGVSFL